MDGLKTGSSNYCLCVYNVLKYVSNVCCAETDRNFAQLVFMCHCFHMCPLQFVTGVDLFNNLLLLLFLYR